MPGAFHTLLHLTLTTLSSEPYYSHFINEETEDLRDSANQHSTVKSQRTDTILPATLLVVLLSLSMLPFCSLQMGRVVYGTLL